MADEVNKVGPSVVSGSVDGGAANKAGVTITSGGANAVRKAAVTVLEKTLLDVQKAGVAVVEKTLVDVQKAGVAVVEKTLVDVQKVGVSAVAGGNDATIPKVSISVILKPDGIPKSQYIKA